VCCYNLSEHDDIIKPFVAVTSTSRHRVYCTNRALLDTGCDVYVMSSRILPDVPYQESSQQILAANSSPVPILGTATVAFTIGKLQVTHQCLVSDAIEEIILGPDWLEGHKCIWDAFGTSRRAI
jgi:predicted aspartyl protease